MFSKNIFHLVCGMVIFLVGCNSSQDPALEDTVNISVYYKLNDKNREDVKQALEHYVLPLEAKQCGMTIYPESKLHFDIDLKRSIIFPSKTLDEYKKIVSKAGNVNVADMDRVLADDFNALKLAIPKEPIALPDNVIKTSLKQMRTDAGNNQRIYLILDNANLFSESEKRRFKDLIAQKEDATEAVFSIKKSATMESVKEQLGKILCARIDNETKRLSKTEILVIDSQLFIRETVEPPEVVPVAPKPPEVAPKPPVAAPVAPKRTVVVPVAPKPAVVAPVAPKPTMTPTVTPATPPISQVNLNTADCNQLLDDLKSTMKYSSEELIGRTKPWTIIGHASQHCKDKPQWAQFKAYCTSIKSAVGTIANGTMELKCD